MKHKHAKHSLPVVWRRGVLIVVVGVFSIVGIWLLASTRAATNAVGVEAETGVAIGTATLKSSTSASAGQYVIFGSSMPNPNPNPNPSPGQLSPYGMAEGGLLQHMSNAELNSTLDGYQSIGVKWVRTDIDWLRVQAGGQNSWNWGAYDQVVNAIIAHGMEVVGILAYPPDWAASSGCSDNYHCVPRNMADYAAFSKAAAERYAPKGVYVWEIWNEPNGGTFSPAQYAAMMKAAYPALKAGNPKSLVLAGGSMPNDTSGNGYSPVDFLKGIYASGGKGYFDALTHHPYCWGGGDAFNCPKAYAEWSAWTQMAETNPSLRSLMVSNGDGNKKIWLTEMGAPTSGDAGKVSEANQARQLTESYAMVKGLPWAGPLFWYHYKDKGSANNNSENWFGILRRDGSQKPAYEAYRTATGK